MSHMTKQDWTEAQETTYSKKGFGETGMALGEVKTPEDKRHIAIILKYLGVPPKKVLDVACNDGSITKFLKDKGYDVIGIDLPKIIEKTKKLNPDCDFRVLDVDTETNEAPQFKDTFDIIYAGAVIEHLIYDVSFLRNMYSYLKEDGVIIVTTGTNIEKTEEEETSHIRCYTLGSLRNMMKYGCGFEVTYTENVKEDGLILVVGKR